MKRKIGLCVVGLVVCFAIGAGAGSNDTAKAEDVEYSREVKPLIGSETHLGIQESEANIINVPTHRDFKSYMGYKSITSYYQKDLQDVAHTGDYGIRMLDGRYCVAVGTACNAEIGDYGTLVLENGETIPIIIGDIKADSTTGGDNIISSENGCCSEFIVDLNSLDATAKRMGSISYCCDEWQSPVVQIKIYETNYLGL